MTVIFITEDYLGYKSYPKVIEKIRENIENAAVRLNDKGMIFYDHRTKNICTLSMISLEALKREFVGSNKEFIPHFI